LCCDDSAGCTTDDRANRRSAAAAYRAPDDRPGRATEDCTADRILCGRILHWHRKRKRQKSRGSHSFMHVPLPVTGIHLLQ
jgi:hypothetical protein